MALEILPPDLKAGEDSITTKEAQAYFKPSTLKDGESEEFRLLGCYSTGHAITGWQYASECTDEKTGELRFNGYVVTKTHPGTPSDLARDTDWSKPDRPKIDGTFVKPRKFLAWVAMSASRSRLEVLFIEQKSLREQLAEVLQESDDFTWSEQGLANFSIKISRKGTGLETSYSILPKVRKVPEKIVKQWETDKESIWLPNYFIGEDPFAGKKTDEKGLPNVATDKRGAMVTPTTETKSDDENDEF